MHGSQGLVTAPHVHHTDLTLVVVHRMDEVRGEARELARAAGGALVLGGPREEPGARHLELGDDLAGVHDLVARIGAELDELRPERVLCPTLHEGESCRRAAAAATVAALSTREELELSFYSLEGDVSSGETTSEEAFQQRGSARAPTATAVISTWNKASDVCQNLAALRGQTELFDDVIVVDNASSDDTAERIARDFPEVRLIVMPSSDYGACETFNVGFASATTELVAILDDDIVMSPGWLERAKARLAREPESTAILSTKIVEPEMPQSYRDSAALNAERYMATFRGCASLARAKALREARYYDERLFIYGNERDLTCRLLNLGYRVLQYPGAEVFHKTPFGIKMGKRSLYYHARNAFLSMLKYAPLADLVKMPFLVVSKVLFRSSDEERSGEVTDATGTIGITRSLRETPGAWWVLVRAAASVLWNVPYCLKHREPVRAPDFELPLR